MSKPLISLAHHVRDKNEPTSSKYLCDNGNTNFAYVCYETLQL